MGEFNRMQLGQKFTNILCSNAKLFKNRGHAKGSIFKIIASQAWIKRKKDIKNHFIAMKLEIDIATIAFISTCQFNFLRLLKNLL